MYNIYSIRKKGFYLWAFCLMILSQNVFSQTDGVIIKDIWKGLDSGTGYEFISINDKIIVFKGNDNSGAGEELWISDGTETGTKLLKDINAGSKSSSPRNFKRYNNIITFEATDNKGYKLFRTDGTDSGTFEIWDRGYFSTSNAESEIKPPVELVNGNETYWLTDLNGNAAVIKKDLNTSKFNVLAEEAIGINISKISKENILEKKQFFSFLNGKWLFNSYQSFISTDRYSLVARDISSANKTTLITSNGYMSFLVSNTNSGEKAFTLIHNSTTKKIELWVTDGTVSETKKIYTFSTENIYYSNLEITGKQVEGGVIFTLSQGYGPELWFSDGTSNGTKKIENTPFDFMSFFNVEDNKLPIIYFAGSHQLYRVIDSKFTLQRLGPPSFISPLNAIKKGDYLYINSGPELFVRLNLKNNQLTHYSGLNSGILYTPFDIIENQLIYQNITFTTGVELWKRDFCTHEPLILTPDGSSICEGGSVKISGDVKGTSSYTFKWTKESFSTSLGSNKDLTVNQSGVYVLNVTDKNGCTVSTSVEIKKTNNISVAITGTDTFCSGQSSTITGTVSGGVAPYTYAWEYNSSNVGTNTNSYNASYPGAYYLNIKDSKGCKATGNIMIRLKPSPNVYITKSGSTDLITGGSVTLSVPTASNQTYQWQKDGTAIASATNNTYTATGAGAFAVTVTGNGCSATSEKVTVNLILANETLEVSDIIKVYPNPAENHIKVIIQEPLKKTAQLNLIDASGVIIKEWKVKQQENTLDLRNLPVGTYLLHSQVNDKQIIQKIIKQN